MSKTESCELFVSGRLCLFGEHSDWAAEFNLHPGFCMVVGTDQGLSAQARPAEDFSVEARMFDPHGRPTGLTRKMACDHSPETLLAAAQDDQEFFRYCAGVAYEMQTRHGVGGLELKITKSDLPLKKGVSSSAAVCILVAKAFNAAYKLGLFFHELMELAYLGEALTGSKCGRMDQACIYGHTPVLLTFGDSPRPLIEPIFTRGRMDLFFVDLAGKKDTVKILADLRDAYLKNDPLQKALGQENERILRSAYVAVGQGDAKKLGELMTRAQANFDEKVAPHSPEDLTSPLLHELLALEPLQKHIFGGKGVGSQGDGTAQFVARSAADRQAAMDLIEQTYPSMKCFPLTIGAAGG